ncbi:uncharacterized protein LOC116259814 [Nymphaea colorata]|nr:uncharacterized protein LOC116259814 [Nymphaea colorata]
MSLRCSFGLPHSRLFAAPPPLPPRAVAGAPISIALLPTRFGSTSPIHHPSSARFLGNPFPQVPCAIKATEMDAQKETEAVHGGDSADSAMKLLFVEMGVGYDQHGQDITAAAMRACRDAIASNSIPAFRIGSIPGASPEHMKLKIKLGVPRSVQQHLDIEKVKSVFPYGKVVSFEAVDGGLICSSGTCLEEMGDKNDDCFVVNAAVYVGY